MTETNKPHYDLSPAGMGELMKAPILATLGSLDFPYIRLQQEQTAEGESFYIGVVVLEMGDQLILEMAGATAFREALAIIAYQQQMSKTPLLIDDEMEQAVGYFTHFAKQRGVNPLIEHRTGNEITLEMMTASNREQVDLILMQHRIAQEKS